MGGEHHGVIGFPGNPDHDVLGVQPCEGFKAGFAVLGRVGGLRQRHGIGMDLRLMSEVLEHGDDLVPGPGVCLGVKDAVGFVGEGVDQLFGAIR